MSKYLVVGLCFLLCACCPREKDTWQDEFNQTLPLLGHRNWIVVTDMAYPQQTQAGIKTVYTADSYLNVLDIVNKGIEQNPHVKSNIYMDQELSYIDQQHITGIDTLKLGIQQIVGDRICFVKHEKLIAKIDSVSKLYNVIILKTKLAMPYTSVFFELDCKYWNESLQTELETKMFVAKQDNNTSSTALSHNE